MDCGSGSTRVGYSGEDCPKIVYPSVSFKPKLFRMSYLQLIGCSCDSKEMVVESGSAKPARYIGNAQLGFRRDHVELKWPFTADGLYQDWDALTDLWSHAFDNQLKLNLEENPILFCEPTRLMDNQRERLVERLFETYPTPAIYLGKNSVLSSFASGRQTSLVVDCGFAGSTSKNV